ncbi:biotin/lipoyl-containing protein [Kiritimatiella glycovorans]|uniref:Dihydrolipoyllysine-residue acetyltransferase component of pyruvate dehydrogenase complex n=1 Tax=Kiritimatiella glycovorans TaxID=1307763 RepID=A0A0G3EKH7_9BACT|nr:biotin/lipoyl-containing protein [Kiritimatiella glycovorans]AKJ64679.1 Dihydrolipoyllysine-residue acetyltransferase component of pyruvate dehydrogenase complex [Kiritimatiella glycovorans]
MAEAQPVRMPKLGQTVEEAEIVNWHKKEGDAVEKGETLFEVETDKAVLEAESFYEGTLLKIVVPEGKSVPVQSVVAYVGAEGDTIPEAPPQEAPKPQPEKRAAPAAKAEAPKAEQPAAAPSPAAAARSRPRLPARNAPSSARARRNSAGSTWSSRTTPFPPRARTDGSSNGT